MEVRVTNSSNYTSVIDTFSDWIAHAPRRHSTLAIERSKAAFLDTLGCICLSANQAPTLTALRAAQSWGAGPALVIGTSQRLPSPWAAFINATAAHALDFDDWDMPANSHPSAVLVPALLALGEEAGASGMDLIDAYVAGLEIIIRLGEAVNMDHFSRGWHTTATLCVFGATAASARLLKLSAGETAAALGIAVSMSAGNNCQIGTMTKPFHAGFAAKNGIVAATLGRSGATSSHKAIELGFAVTHCSVDIPGFAGPLAKLGHPSAIEEYGLVTKRYPSCGYTHRIVDGVIELCEQHDIRPNDIATILATIPQHFLNALRYKVPKDEREALFSLPYCIAASIQDRKLTFDHFTPAAIAMSGVLDIISRVDIESYVAKDPNINMGPAAPDTIKITLKNGKAFEASIDYPVGTIAKPISKAELETKFRACCRILLSDVQTLKVIEKVQGLDRLNSVRELTRLLMVNSEPAPKSAATAAAS